MQRWGGRERQLLHNYMYSLQDSQFVFFYPIYVSCVNYVTFHINCIRYAGFNVPIFGDTVIKLHKINCLFKNYD